MLDNYFSFDQLNALKVMRVDQLKNYPERISKNIRLKKN